MLPAGADARAAARRLAAAPGVEGAEPDVLYHLAWTAGAGFFPDDPRFADGTQWGLWNTGTGPSGGVAGADIRAPLGWAITTGSTTTVLGIVDTGFDLHHPELGGLLADGSPRVIRAFNSSIEGPGGAPDDSVGHGTIVAGVAFAPVEQRGRAGRRDRGRQRRLGRGFGRLPDRRGQGHADPPDATRSARSWRRGSPTRWSPGRGRSTCRSAATRTTATCATPCRSPSAAAASSSAARATAGARPDDARPQYPGYYARYGNGVSVAAIKSDGTLARFSSRGPQIDVAAPGEDIMSTFLDLPQRLRLAAARLRGVLGHVVRRAVRHRPRGARVHRAARHDRQRVPGRAPPHRARRRRAGPGRRLRLGHSRRARAAHGAPAAARGSSAARVDAQSWSKVSTDSVTLSKTRMAVNGCSIDGRYLAERWEVRTHVTLPPGLVLETPQVIVRAHGTNGQGGWPNAHAARVRRARLRRGDSRDGDEGRLRPAHLRLPHRRPAADLLGDQPDRLSSRTSRGTCASPGARSPAATPRRR